MRRLPHIDRDMKRSPLFIGGAAALLSLGLALGGCAQSPDYARYVSDYRSEIYRGENEELSLTAFFGEREYPYAADGVCAEKAPFAEIYMTAPDNTKDYEVYFTVNGKEYGGDMSYDSVYARFFYSESVEAVSLPSLSFTVVCDGEETVVEAASVKAGNEMTMPAIIDRLVAQRTDLFENLTSGGTFNGELYVRLVYNEKCYWFVGVVSAEEWSDYFLLDAVTGNIMAERTHG